MVTIPKLLDVKALALYKLSLSYADGKNGEIDISNLKGEGIFKRWEQPGYFQQVFIPKDHNAVAWDAELELCPNALYLELIGKDYQEYAKDK